jgi:GNAT superfamily N-acetyltransferase
VDPADVESLERATVAAVAPPEVLELDGWLAPFDAGTIGRAKSAVPLSHTPGLHGLVGVLGAYHERGLPAAFRLAEVEGLGPVRAILAQQGYRGGKPTLVKIGPAEALADFADPTAEILAQPDEAWGAVFLGEGFDPADGAHRVAALSRSPDALYGAVREDGRIVAVGVASFGHGWAGIHGMRTALDRRGRGHAGRILASLGQAIRARGCQRVFLQVEEANPARSLYRRAGFWEAWTYRYWTR